jgi:protease IV
MSYDPSAAIPVLQVTPVHRSSWGWFWRLLFAFVLFISLTINFLMLLLIMIGLGIYGSDASDETGSALFEHLHSGDAKASDKIAIVDVDGVLVEGMTGFAQKQIDRAARDKHVKAVVLRIESPGGSITASDDLHHRLIELRDGNASKATAAKPIIVSMGSLAASGGYYIAMPAKRLFAEQTTMTGSIGVYAALPNVKELGDKIGFKLLVIKAGEVKDSGSPFADMTPKERTMWQHLVDESYLQFLHVVEVGRPELKGKLQEDVHINETLPIRTTQGMEKKVDLTRYRADGGVYTSAEALKLGLVDQIGYLDDAIEAARSAANLGTSFKSIRYERPHTLLGSLLGVQSQPPASAFDWSAISASATPRLWYLSPGAEPAGLIAAASRK